ncbi:F-box domain, Leucine-rich repeat domain, L domain-like protein [Artemisia annua]|uniref:F-box domain, Leucine-rich repeat domain, L domain-like protein n=1 Tax=Artemisia annua TaxID=35608 RepID=A0A2U1P8S7_ARTAN|nr:F-box domain, Leucine-rich repeat domain, L domain-like protein [Artemisia annua]
MKKNTKDTTDRISMLPDFIVHHILSYLREDTKSLVRMSVLSKEWFSLTASFPLLYFHLEAWYIFIPSEYTCEYLREAFYRYVEYTVSRFCDQNISAHTLDIYAEFESLEQIELFGRCLELVIEKGLQVFVIKTESRDKNLPMFRLPNTLLSASSLTSLTLCKCELPSSLMVGVVKFKSLKLLSLTKLPIKEGEIEYLTKSCPLIEEIYLKSCYGFKTFCVNRHHNLLKVEICCESRLERIDVDAPNLSYFRVDNKTDEAPSMSLGSCKKLTTFCYSGSPLKRINDFLSNFPFIENLFLDLPPHVNNLKLSNHSLRKIQLHSHCDLEEIDLNTPSLLLFKYYDRSYDANFGLLSRKHSSMSCMQCATQDSLDILWCQKFRQFLEKNSIFKVLKLVICLVFPQKPIDVKELKLMQLPPYELEDVELIYKYSIFLQKELKLLQSPPYKLEDLELIYKYTSSIYVASVDAVLWCCRPRSLTLNLYFYPDTSHVAKYTYEKLLQQEDEGQTNIKFVLISSSKGEQHFSDLISLLKELSLGHSRCKITFIKEKGSRLIKYANREISSSVGLRNVSVMSEVQKVTSTTRELDLVFSVLEESVATSSKNLIL